MNDKISDKDKKDWENFLSGNEKLVNKDQKFIEKNLENINCYSNEADKWEKSNTTISGTVLSIEFRAQFEPRRGRVNCSLNDDGKWRWFGVQFPVKTN